MKKDLKELVRISFEGVDLLGHIEINNDTKLLNLRTDNHELIERFDKNWDETFVFHCKKLKWKVH
ncbi:hypothetical protein [Sinobaca sp. H24]|uniref:hypothetical protein n=1 Tax=Sinobaca sp. H24 TaxID=2923376 RepID=UPI00207A43EB|nr:hypothetical protein [Sinobaca sp. H24]